MVHAGTVSEAEGERLLAALAATPKKRPAWRLSFDPFERFGGGVAAGLGLGVSALAVVTTRFGGRFDGCLDFHLTGENVAPLRTSLLEQSIDWAVPALLFFGYARALTAGVRLVDFIGFVGLARAPLLLAALLGLVLAPPMAPHGAGGLPVISPALILLGLAMLPLVAWFGVLLYFGFKNASGLAGPKLGVGFGAMLLASEVVSKLALAAVG